MKRFIILLTLMGVMFAMSPSTTMASQHTDGVSATVTPAFVAITATAQNTTYGSRDLGSTGNLPTGQSGDTNELAAFRVENTGTKDADWSIVGGASTAWSIGDTAGPSTYVHSYDTASTGGVPDAPLSLDTPSDLGLAVTASTIVRVWLTLDMPTAGLITTEQTLGITITATASS